MIMMKKKWLNRTTVSLASAAVAAAALALIILNAREKSGETRPASPAVHPAAGKPSSAAAKRTARATRAPAAVPFPVPSMVKRVYDSASCPPLEELSNPVRWTLDIERKLSYTERSRGAALLPHPTSDADLKALEWYLTSKDPDKYGDTAENSIKNDVLEHLIGLEQLPHELGWLMLGVFHDQEQDEVWRDYVLQHFSRYMEKRWRGDGAPGMENDLERKAIHDAFLAALSETDSHIAGTALIGMELVTRTFNDFKKDEVAAAALAIAADGSAGTAARASAFGVCSILGKAEALDSAKVVASIQDAEFPLRLSAIATLGAFGGAEERAALEAISKDGQTDQMIRNAASAALRKISERGAIAQGSNGNG